MTGATQTADCLIAAAHRVGERAAREAEQADRDCRLSDGLVQDMVDGGLIGMLQPRHWGGLEVGFDTYVRVCEVVARYDVAASWVQMILSIHHWWGALASPELQHELWADNPHRIFADVFAPVGEVVPERDGVRLSGRWSFASGILWSEYVALGAIGAPEPGAEPEYLMCFVPKADYRVVNDWDTVGLRGTGSCTVEVQDAFVPAHRIVKLARIVETGQAPGHALHPGHIYHLPFAAALAIALVPTNVGAMRGAVEQFQARMKTRTPLFTGERMDALASSQTLVAEAALATDACEALMHRYAGELMALPPDQDGGSALAFRVRAFGWRAWVGRQARENIAALFTHAGASAIYAGNPLQRRWRDIHAMAQHVVINYEIGVRNYGRHLAGQPPAPGIY